ncbi:protein FAR1-RELATED SEQUENCE 3-like [Actinidia eriantha]|uniref:protein FAR1-RELATED SEQUENCE 3-like n=1 Tax=Actinidia eriantha TaxID=165200 RepID=UPI00258C704E|nr:protein FAR1-RELATED SEQUENCE 3-like [Actinidia eriantha]XP_057467766.1 protein FAR1-RELATED SEQUENCE 3-like [Actinidia eriantha]
MDVETIDLENVDNYVEVDEGDLEINEHAVVGPDNSTENFLSTQDEVWVDEPHVGMEFESEDAAKTFYDEYARRVGFSTCVNQFSRSESGDKTNAREFLCAREGLKRKNSERCNAMLKIERKDPGKWIVSKFLKEHSHSTVTPSKVHYLRPRKLFSGTNKGMDESYSEGRTSSTVMMDVSVDGNHVSGEWIRGNPRAKTPVRSGHRKGNIGDAQNLLDYFKNMQAEHPGFYYAVQLDKSNCMTNVFWADARSRTAYRNFGDAVTFDTTSRTNNCKVPYASFTGVNHHGQMVLFGCGLVVDESESSFTWLFRTWLTAMNDQPPLSITTDQDKVIKSAVSKVFPSTRHRICKWHVLGEGQRRLDRLRKNHPALNGDLYNCINMAETIEEFESSWNSLIDKYHQQRNDWLQALYSTREHWVPVYFRDSFFASISSDQGSEAAVSFFDGYADEQTTLPMFFSNYERALEQSFQKEIEADFDTVRTMPLLKTPSPMEKQAANVYTRKIFMKFQEELVETFAYTANKEYGDGPFSRYRVAKFEDQQKAYIVSLNILELRATCSCQMFEYSGILCRHVLTVFTVTNVFTLPSHYVKKRWTRHAKSEAGLDDRGVEVEGSESLALRYNSLCREAMKYAEEGAIAVEMYSVAMNAIREGRKKVAVAMKDAVKVTPKPQVCGSQEDGNKEIDVSKAEMTPLLWPNVQVKHQSAVNDSDMNRTPWRSYQDGATHLLNRNDIGACTPTPQKDLPCMAPLSLQQDDGTSNDTVILPYLRSMTWLMENKSLRPAKRVAIINFKLRDYDNGTSGETEVKFQLSKVTLEPMLSSMASIGEQLATASNQVAVINLKLQDSDAISGETEVKFQVSKDTLGAMLRSMAYIREQLLDTVQPQLQPSLKKQRQ